MVDGACSVSSSTSATSSRGTGPRRPSAVETSTRPEPGSFSRLPGRTIVQSSELAATRGVGVGLGAQVGAHRLGPCVRILRADRRDDHEARHAGRLGGLDALHGGAEVDGVLALRPGAGTGAGGEDDRVGAVERAGRHRRARGRRGSAAPPSASMSAAWSGLRIRARAVCPSAARRRMSRRATCPWPPAMRTSMPIRGYRVMATVLVVYAQKSVRADSARCAGRAGPGRAARPADDRVRGAARLLGGLLAHERAADDRGARDPQRLGRHDCGGRVDERAAA